MLLLFGIWIGGHPDVLPNPIRDVFVDDERTRVIEEAVDAITERHYRAVDGDELTDAAIAAMVDSLDDQFAGYFNPQEYRRFRETQNSQFSGVGIAITGHPRGLRVLEVYDDSPAKRAGIMRGDLIVGAGSRSLNGLSEEETTSLIKGPAGTDVTIVVQRGERRRRLELTRATIAVPVVATHRVNHEGRRYAHIRLASFTSGAHAEVRQAVRRSLAGGATGIVFDLRANGGGLVSEAQLVTSIFLESGAIVTTKGRAVPTRTLRATGTAVAPKTPLVVLVDGDTASASEIVAGALQDDRRARLVGTRTFGKGVFQEIIELSNGGALDITAGQYFTPKGRNLGGAGTARGGGLTPDVRARDDAATRRDEALQRALGVLAAQVRSGQAR